jgi:hypothetical protein
MHSDNIYNLHSLEKTVGVFKWCMRDAEFRLENMEKRNHLRHL